jgi:hypothetical protein
MLYPQNNPFQSKAVFLPPIHFSIFYQNNLSQCQFFSLAANLLLLQYEKRINLSQSNY